SDMYNHFKMPAEIKIEGDSVKYIFVCKSKPSTQVAHARQDDSTSNLLAHKIRWAPELAAGNASIKNFAHGSSYCPAQLQYLLVLWVAHRHCPYTIVEDAELLEILWMLFDPVAVPSAHTVSRDVQEIFVISQHEAYDGKLHLRVDGWAVPNIFSFLGITVTRCVSEDLITMILDFIRLVWSPW
ncbi:hypothetical protein K439DRAFT_1337987, partial [Ramaria rubella]